MGRKKMDVRTLQDIPPWDWPKDADSIFLDVLRDDQADASDRLIAAELAGDCTVINDELAEALLSIVRSSDEPEGLRGRAAISLGPALEYADMEGFEDDDEFDLPNDVPISEGTFQKIQDSFRRFYMDADVPKEVRRSVLEASVRAPQKWHQDAVRAAYISGDESWRLTSVFCMRFVRGFDDKILEALESENEDIHYEAVCAAGNWELDAAWSHIVDLATAEETDKALRLAAIDALPGIRPHEAAAILVDLTDSDDEDIAEAAFEAMGMAEGFDDDDEEEYDKFH